jgi:hypothetical protein
MKKKFLLTLTLFSCVFAFMANAQTKNKAYAITGSKTNLHSWTNIKEVDVTTGAVNKLVFDASASADATITHPAGKVYQSIQDGLPTAWGVAAAALDARHNRLYFAPLHLAEIRFLDLNTGAFTVVKDNVLTNNTNLYQTEENHITRMVIAADGFGYAITNDANHLIRFSTSKKATIEDLGAIADAKENNGMSIHNKCTSWGGDVVADAFGNIVIISANRNVFELDVNSRIATYKGTITGLPSTFTTNGAAVTPSGAIVVSNAVAEDGLFSVDAKTLVATKIENAAANFNASDLATANMLNQKAFDEKNTFVGSAGTFTNTDVISGNAKVFPNPVTNNTFKVYLNEQAMGQYKIVITDLQGKLVNAQNVNVGVKGQIETVRIDAATAKGMYLVKLVDAQNQVVFTERIVVQ